MSSSEDDQWKGVQILKFIGFEIECLGADVSKGRFVVSERSCQPYGVLHGGTTAYIAESLASISAGIAAEFARVAGIEMNVSHLRSASLGEEVLVICKPVRLGKRIQDFIEVVEPQGSFFKPPLTVFHGVTITENVYIHRPFDRNRLRLLYTKFAREGKNNEEMDDIEFYPRHATIVEVLEVFLMVVEEVWEVNFETEMKKKGSDISPPSSERVLVAVARVTLLIGLAITSKL